VALIHKHIRQSFSASSIGVCGWQKMTSVRFSVRFFKKLRFSVRFWFYKINRGFVFQLGFLHVCCLISMMLEMYFRAELVQLIVSQSDSELEVQRYDMKKNTLTVDSIMLQDELWMRQCEKPSPNCRCRFFWKPNRGNRVFGFWILKSVRLLENRYPTFSSGSAYPILWQCWLCDKKGD